MKVRDVELAERSIEALNRSSIGVFEPAGELDVSRWWLGKVGYALIANLRADSAQLSSRLEVTTAHVAELEAEQVSAAERYRLTGAISNSIVAKHAAERQTACCRRPASRRWSRFASRPRSGRKSASKARR